MPLSCTISVVLIVLLTRDEYASAFRRPALVSIPIPGGSMRSVVHADFDGNGVDERFQLFRSGRAGTLVSPEGARTWWQFNGDREYQDVGAVDVAGHSAPEVWLRSSTKDVHYILFLDGISGAAVDSIILHARDFPQGDPFHPRGGAFDGAAIPIDRVTLPSGRAGVLLEFRCGHNLMPRGFAAWDLAAGRLAWRVPMGPTPNTDRHQSIRSPKQPEGIYVAGTVAPCNGSDSLGIPDWNYGIIALSAAGRIAWWRCLGEGFGESICDLAGDSARATPSVVAVAHSASRDGPAPCLLSLRVDDGATIDSMTLPAIPAHVVACDMDADGRDEAVISYADGRLEGRRVERGFPVVRRGRLRRGMEARLVCRRPGDGSNVLLCADSTRIRLLDLQFRNLIETPWPSGSTQNVLLRTVRLPGDQVGLAQTGGEGFLFRISSRPAATATGLGLLGITVAALGLPWVVARRERKSLLSREDAPARALRPAGHSLHRATRDLFHYLQERSHSCSLGRTESAANALLSISHKAGLTEEQLCDDEVWDELLGVSELVRAEILEGILPDAVTLARAARVPRGIISDALLVKGLFGERLGELARTAAAAGQRRVLVLKLGDSAQGVWAVLQRLGDVAAHRLAEPVGPLVDEVLRDVWPTCGLGGREIHLGVGYAVPRDTRVVVGVDAFGIVLRNLLKNAIAAVEGRPIRRIELRVEPAGTMRPKLDLVIHDSGPGVPPEIRSAIFTGFSTRGGGAGLRDAQAAVQRYRGDVLGPEDCEAGGAQFRVRLCRDDYFTGGF
jgi:signal transduction histidine kinase